jgi:lysozyme
MRGIVKAALAVLGAGGGAAAIAAALIAPHEGLSLDAYRDSVGVWTICRGHTATAGPGKSYSRERCDELFESEVGEFLAAVDERVKPDIPPVSLAAITSLCYNVGVSTCAPVIRRVNAGNLRGACEAISLYVYAGGRNCRDPASNCRGIVTRRQDERALCLAGLEAGG